MNGSQPMVVGRPAVVPQYALGDPAQPEHLEAPPTDDEHREAVARLGPGDPCFVLRSRGGFAFARVLTQTDATIELEVTREGFRKTVPMEKCAKYVRTLPPSMVPTMVRRASVEPSSPFERRGSWPDLASGARVVSLGDLRRRPPPATPGPPSHSLVRKKDRSREDLGARFQSDLDNWRPSPNPSPPPNASAMSSRCLSQRPLPCRSERSNEEWGVLTKPSGSNPPRPSLAEASGSSFQRPSQGSNFQRPSQNEEWGDLAEASGSNFEWRFEESVPRPVSCASFTSILTDKEYKERLTYASFGSMSIAEVDEYC